MHQAPGFGNEAGGTSNAMPGIKEQFRLGCLAFGILAPGTSKGAALEEHDGTYAVTVVGTKALDIEDHTVHDLEYGPTLSFSQYKPSYESLCCNNLQSMVLQAS
jgi:hypothetical protein